jgi:hypothetical protein
MRTTFLSMETKSMPTKHGDLRRDRTLSKLTDRCKLVIFRYMQQRVEKDAVTPFGMSALE